MICTTCECISMGTSQDWKIFCFVNQWAPDYWWMTGMGHEKKILKDKKGFNENYEKDEQEIITGMACAMTPWH